MNVARALVVVTLLCVTLNSHAAPPNAGGAESAAAAQKKLEAARKDLAQAVQRIQVDPPSTADLDAAHAAVTALKSAIDAGADYEASDLDYAKAALAARKELRTQREYVDQRRANVHIHDQRRAIDAAVATLNDRVSRCGRKDASPKDFEEARSAAAAVRKLLAEAQPFGKQDAKFATYLGEVDATVAKQEKAIDDRWTLLELDKHRALFEESRKALSAAMAALGKTATDAQFEAADRALTQLTKRLDEGKVFEPRDPKYRADAEKARAELAQAKKRLDELVSTTAFERLKSEIEPAYQDLKTALKGVRARKPTEEQLAEAKTAAIVVRKLVEKFQPQASRSQAFGQYVNEVSKTLVEVEVELQKRTLDSARAEVTQAVRNIEKRNPTDEQFAELTTALTVLEKTIGSVHQKDPAIAPFVYDARAQIRDARATLELRRYQVSLERQRAKVLETRRNTEAVVKEIQQPKIGKEELQAAENAVKLLRSVLDEGVALVKKDSDYAQLDKQVRDRIRELTDRIAARRIALAASDGRAQLDDALSDAKSKVETAQKPEATDAQLDAAQKSVDALTKALDANTALEKQDKGYAMQAEKTRNEMMRQIEALEIAKLAHALGQKTGGAFSAGVAEAVAATAAQDLRQQRDHYEKAVALFKSCEKEGTSMVQGTPVLAKAGVLVEGRLSTANEVIAQCAERAKATDQLLRQALAVLAFEDGPKRSFQSGSNLLARGKKSEAIPEFEECIASGKIAAYKYPELKERTFDVAGSKMTISELVTLCVNQRKSLVSAK